MIIAQSVTATQSTIDDTLVDYSSTQSYLALAKRSTMPGLMTATSTASSSASTISPSTQSFSSSAKPSLSSAKPLITSTTTSSTGMPVYTTQTSSSSSTSTSYTYQAVVPTNNAANPFIDRQSLPSNSVFIAVAGVLGLLAFGVFLTWIIVWWNSRQRAKTEKEVQYYNPFQYESGANISAVNLIGGSSQSSFMEKSSASLHSKFSDAVSLNFDTTTQGRSYREMSNTIGRRGSMTISPVLEMMRSSASNLDLPLFNPTPDYPSNIPVVSSEPSQSQPVRKSRPPSMVLDDMLTAIEFTNDYPDVFDDHSH